MCSLYKAKFTCRTWVYTTQVGSTMFSVAFLLILSMFWIIILLRSEFISLIERSFEQYFISPNIYQITKKRRCPPPPPNKILISEDVTEHSHTCPVCVVQVDVSRNNILRKTIIIVGVVSQYVVNTPLLAFYVFPSKEINPNIPGFTTAIYLNLTQRQIFLIKWTCHSEPRQVK